MKTTINTSKTVTGIQFYSDGLYERNGSQGKTFFSLDKTINACGYSWFVRIPFLTVIVNVYIK